MKVVCEEDSEGYEYLQNVSDELGGDDDDGDAHGQGPLVTSTGVCGLCGYKESEWGYGAPPLVCFLPDSLPPP